MLYLIDNAISLFSISVFIGSSIMDVVWNNSSIPFLIAHLIYGFQSICVQTYDYSINSLKRFDIFFAAQKLLAIISNLG